MADVPPLLSRSILVANSSHSAVAATAAGAGEGGGFRPDASSRPMSAMSTSSRPKSASRTKLSSERSGAYRDGVRPWSSLGRGSRMEFDKKMNHGSDIRGVVSKGDVNDDDDDNDDNSADECNDHDHITIKSDHQIIFNRYPKPQVSSLLAPQKQIPRPQSAPRRGLLFLPSFDVGGFSLLTCFVSTFPRSLRCSMHVVDTYSYI